MNIVLIVLKKELTDIFRDKKSLILGILIPLLIYPIIFGVMGKSMKNDSEEVKKNIKIAIIDKSKSSLGQFIISQENIEVVATENLTEQVKSGKILLGIEIPENFDNNISKEKENEVKIIYDNSSSKSSIAKSIINSYFDIFTKEIVSQRLSKRNIDTSILNPVSIKAITAEKEKDGAGKLILSMMLPMILIMFASIGPVATATDLGAGEKERGTLEPLLTTKASRLSLLWGKFLAITIMGGITAIAALLGVFISIKDNNEVFGGTSGTFSIDIKALIIIGVLTILLTMVFAAIDLTISIYARSFKEAQTYLTPMSLVGMLGFSSYMVDAKNVSMAFLNIPIINVVSVIKELIMGVFNYSHIGIVLIWCIVYVIVSISFAKYMFGREDVIFRT